MIKKAIIFLVFAVPFSCSALTVVHISDIHASNQKTRKNAKIMSPRMYEKCLKEVRGLGAGLIIATGDIANKAGKKYYLRVRNVLKGAEVIWVKGNHDKIKDFKVLSPQNYYYRDKEDWRIIVLDSTIQYGTSTGYLNEAQIQFLQSAEQMEKNVIVAMHHPPFAYDSRTELYSSERNSRYENFFAALSPNVKYVLTGHWHHTMNVETDGVSYQTFTGLSQDKRCNYNIIELVSDQ